MIPISVILTKHFPKNTALKVYYGMFMFYLLIRRFKILVVTLVTYRLFIDPKRPIPFYNSSFHTITT